MLILSFSDYDVVVAMWINTEKLQVILLYKILKYW